MQTGPSSVNYVDSTFDGRPLVYHSDRQALSTARFRRACSLATANTYLVVVLVIVNHKNQLSQINPRDSIVLNPSDKLVVDSRTYCQLSSPTTVQFARRQSTFVELS